MGIAAYKDLCIDAGNADVMAAFWASALGLSVRRRPDGAAPARLDGPTPEHGIWVNPVSEPRTVKQRVHLDVHADSVGDLERLGAARLPHGAGLPWTVMADPEGGELCLFARSDPPPLRLADVPVDWNDPYRLYEVCVDSADPDAIARWWGEVLGAPVHHSDRGFAWVSDIPGTPFGSIAFLAVEEPKSVKNRIHWDVCVEDLAGLQDSGATVLREQDDEIAWTVMADPEGNEFCAFVR